MRSIIDLAHNLSLSVVAEGVEDEETMDMLVEYGCDTAQGYYFSRPLPADQLVHWLETSEFGTAGDTRQSDHGYVTSFDVTVVGQMV